MLNDLVIENNHLTGNIPEGIGDLENLTEIDFGNNQLSGEIPENICNIMYVGLSYNQLCPPYPSCISQDDIDSQDTSNCP